MSELGDAGRDGRGDYAIVIPLPTRSETAGSLAAFLLSWVSPAVAKEALTRLDLEADVPASFESQLSVEQLQADKQKLALVLELLAEVNREKHFLAAALAFCNGLAGRQGDPGSAQAFISLEDDLLRRFLPQPVLQALHAAVGLPGFGRLMRQAVLMAQWNAQKRAYQMRQQVLRTDDWMQESLPFNSGL